MNINEDIFMSTDRSARMPLGINYVGCGEELYNAKNLYATEESAGFDFRADLSGEKHAETIEPGQTFVFNTGLRFAVPKGYMIDVRSRSGLSIKNITVANSPGTIDSDYPKEVGVIMRNNGSEKFTVCHGDKIAQGVVIEIPLVTPSVLSDAEFEMIHSAKGSSRIGGFGSTGVK